MTITPPYLKLYAEIASRESEIREKLFLNKEHYSVFAQIQHFGTEFEQILTVSPRNFAHILAENALIDLQRSLMSAANGRRQDAYGTLRMALEKFLFYIFTSGSEVTFRLWTLGRRDLSWREVTDDDVGVFSHNFIDSFGPELTALRAQFLALSKEIYRECSETIHGNYSKLNQSYVEGDIGWISDWGEKARNILTICLFSWLCRFGETAIIGLDRFDGLFRELLGNIEIVRIKLGWQ